MRPPAELTTARMALRASCRIVRSRYPVWSIWRYNATQDRSAVPPCAEDVLVSRPRATVLVRRLPPGGAAFLSCLGDGGQLGMAADAATGEAADFDLAGCLAAIFDARVVKSVFT